MMVSPFVRRRRLAMEILRLRDEYEYSADRLASAVGVKRQTISRIENGHVRPDPDPIMRILAVFNVGEKRWAQIMTIAREAQERGWTASRSPSPMTAWLACVTRRTRTRSSSSPRRSGQRSPEASGMASSISDNGQRTRARSPSAVAATP